MDELIDNYICFVNNPNVLNEYKDIKKKFDKVKVIIGEPNFIYKKGFDGVYNMLQKLNKSKFNLILFDSDEVIINKEKLISDLNKNIDVYGFPVYMERGDSQEIKYQLYKNDNLLSWFGAVHENQKFNRQPTILEIDSINVKHKNAMDKFSKEIKKNSNGMIILEKAEKNSDSYNRDILYETLTWRIVNENLPHQNRNWFLKHYEINKDVIDYYAKEANEKFNLNLKI